MATLRFEISMSLDGYVTAANPRLEAPMGDGGHVLHEWASDDDGPGRHVHDDSQDTVGASIAGRRTYDTSIADWGADVRPLTPHSRYGSPRTRHGRHH